MDDEKQNIQYVFKLELLKEKRLHFFSFIIYFICFLTISGITIKNLCTITSFINSFVSGIFFSIAILSLSKFIQCFKEVKRE